MNRHVERHPIGRQPDAAHDLGVAALASLMRAAAQDDVVPGDPVVSELSASAGSELIHLGIRNADRRRAIERAELP